ncbi:MAG: ADP-ribosylation factor-like protein [Candidatus Lokiarchaeota archaeon]|nr:ADP-ribosylation factor-like protein [Candidatus Lokiarchaeota archaeon]
MVRFLPDHKIYIKILYWGMGGSGKTTIVDTLYRLTREQDKDITPVAELKKICMASGSTLYFDRGFFQSTKQNKVFYHVYTVAGQSRFSPLRERIFKGTDGVIFVVDSQTHFFEDNIESLKELKKVTTFVEEKELNNQKLSGVSQYGAVKSPECRLIKQIPLVIMLNKQDLNEVIGEEDFKQILKEEKLWYTPDHELSIWNPIIYKTCALYEKQRDVYRSFSECARRIGLYQIYGDGKAPIGDSFRKESPNY